MNVVLGGATRLTDNAEDRVPRWSAALESGRFEEVYQSLSEAVECLETGNLPLEEAIQCYEFGARLAEKCGRILSEAELRVSRLDAELLQSTVTQGSFDDPDSDELT
jgi:exodeoxyribonuclease VII small subunit